MLKMKKSALALAVSLGISGAASASFIDIQEDLSDNSNGGAPTTGSIGGSLDNAPVDGTDSGAGNPDSAITVFEPWLTVEDIPVDLDDAVDNPVSATAQPRSIVYSSDVGLNDQSVLTFDVVGGDIADAEYALWAWDDTAGEWVKVGNKTDDLNGSSGGLSRIVMQIETSASFPDGDEQLLLRDGTVSTEILNNGDRIPPNAILALGVDGPAFDNNPEFVFAQGSSAVTMAVTRAQDGVNDLMAPLAGAETILAEDGGFTAGLAADDAIIDVEASPSRTLFVAEQAIDVDDSDSETSLGTSSAAFNPTFSMPNIGPIFDAGDTWDLSITRADGEFGGVTRVEVDVDSGSNATLVDTTRNVDDEYTFSGDFGTRDIFADPLSISIDNGAGVLAPGVWTATLSVTDDAADAGEDTDFPLEFDLATNAETHDWVLNGAQFQVPYFALGFGDLNYTVFMKLVNQDSNDAEATIDAIVEEVDDTGNRVALSKVTNATLPTLDMMSNTTLSEAQIVTALGLDSSKRYHVSVVITVNAPEDSIHASAFQRDPAGRTDIPVLYTNENDRNWFQ